MRENVDQNNSKYGHCSLCPHYKKERLALMTVIQYIDDNILENSYVQRV